MKLTIAIIAALAGVVLIHAQEAAPAGGRPGGPAGGAGRGGRGLVVPGATPEQMQAINDMNAALAPLTATVNAARNDVAAAAITGIKNETAIRAAIEKLRAAEL